MHISKTKFINYLRCDRFAALEEIYQEKDKAIVSFSDDLDDLMSAENHAKTHVILESMTDDVNQDLIDQDDPQLETMLPYYNQVEIVSGLAISHRFKGETIYSLDTFKQKRFEVEQEGFRFFCFLDGYQEDKDTIRIFETKATTSKKFKDMFFKNKDKEKVPMFISSSTGILTLASDLTDIEGSDFHKKLALLTDRLSSVGRYIYDIAYQRYVFETAHQSEKKRAYYLAVLNSDYIHDGETDLNNEPLYHDDLIVFIDVTSLTKLMMPIVANDVTKVIKRLNTLNANPVDLGPHCQRKDQRQCVFYPVCFNHVPAHNSVFTYMANHNGFVDENNEKRKPFDLINEGYVNLEDIPKSWLKRENNIIQRDVIDDMKPYYHYPKIKDGIGALKYPIYHLDFETFPAPLPRFKGEKPYMQSLFQFSIHVESAPGVCDKDKDHYGFLAKNHEDIREDLIKTMLDVIKDDGGSVMVYNQSFEQTRLKEMAALFPAYQERLFDIIDRLFDLMHILRGNKKLYQALGYDEKEAGGINFYHEALNGSFSIKKVLPIFTSLDYKTLPIGNGTEALTAYAQFPNMSLDVFEKTYQDLIEYCKQDTWAMVEILNALRQISQ
ncbi:MAG: DUF2779 domain-containing protein [Acholeplasmataceae bacterium]